MGARWGKVGWRGGGRRDGFCRAAEGAGGAGTQRWRAGGDWERVGGVLKWSACHSYVGCTRGGVGAPGSEHGGETGRAWWWALHVLLLLGSGWLWLRLRGVRTRDASSEPEQGKKEKTASKIPFRVCLGVHASACACPLVCPVPNRFRRRYSTLSERSIEGLIYSRLVTSHPFPVLINKGWGPMAGGRCSRVVGGQGSGCCTALGALGAVAWGTDGFMPAAEMQGAFYQQTDSIHKQT